MITNKHLSQCRRITECWMGLPEDDPLRQAVYEAAVRGDADSALSALDGARERLGVLVDKLNEIHERVARERQAQADAMARLASSPLPHRSGTL